MDPTSPSLIARKIDSRVSSSLILALQYIRNDRTITDSSIHWIPSNESHIPNISIIDQSLDREQWLDWLFPLTINYYERLLKEFFVTLNIPSGTLLPKLHETGDAFLFQLTCCHLMATHPYNISNYSKTTCRNCSRNDLMSSRLSQDHHLLSSLASFISWEEICVGLICGKISPIYPAASRHLLNWMISKPSVAVLLSSLNELRQ